MKTQPYIRLYYGNVVMDGPMDEIEFIKKLILEAQMNQTRKSARVS